MPNPPVNTSTEHRAFYSYRKNPFSVATLFGEKIYVSLLAKKTQSSSQVLTPCLNGGFLHRSGDLASIPRPMLHTVVGPRKWISAETKNGTSGGKETFFRFYKFHQPKPTQPTPNHPTIGSLNRFRSFEGPTSWDSWGLGTTRIWLLESSKE